MLPGGGRNDYRAMFGLGISPSSCPVESSFGKSIKEKQPIRTEKSCPSRQTPLSSADQMLHMISLGNPPRSTFATGTGSNAWVFRNAVEVQPTEGQNSKSKHIASPNLFNQQPVTPSGTKEINSKAATLDLQLELPSSS